MTSQGLMTNDAPKRRFGSDVLSIYSMYTVYICHMYTVHKKYRLSNIRFGTDSSVCKDRKAWTRAVHKGRRDTHLVSGL
jgi:hypothetical protein